MRNLIFIFLIGLFAFSCASPNYGPKQSTSKVEVVQAVSHQTSVPVIMVADDATLPAPDTPVKWIDENFWTFVTGIVFSLYEFLALKLPTSKSVSLIGNLYKLLTWFFPDKSKDGGTFSIRDKL
jgi:hypothetical protein